MLGMSEKNCSERSTSSDAVANIPAAIVADRRSQVLKCLSKSDVDCPGFATLQGLRVG